MMRGFEDKDHAFNHLELSVLLCERHALISRRNQTTYDILYKLKDINRS